MGQLFLRSGVLFFLMTALAQAAEIAPSSMSVKTGTYDGGVSALRAAGDGSLLYLYSNGNGNLNASFVFKSVPSSGVSLSGVFKQTTSSNVYAFQALNASGAWVTLGKASGSGWQSLNFTVPSSEVVSGKVTVRIIAGPSADDCILDLLVLNAGVSPSPSPSPSPSSTPSPSPSPIPSPSSSIGVSWSQIGSYAVQYNNVSLSALEQAPFSMYILDRGDSNGVDWTATELAPVKAHHFLAGYFDGTHAENWRSYWTGSSASYIIGSTSYSGEYFVDLNSSAWLAISKAYIDALAGMGFQAVFIDNCDAYNSSKLASFYGSTQAAEQATIQFLQTLRSYAASKYGMVLIANNGIELASMSGYSSAVDGLMYEDIFGGNSASTIDQITGQLNIAKGLGKTILDVEVTSGLSMAETYVSDAKDLGYVPYVTSDANYGTLGLAGQPNGFVSGE